MVASSTQGSSLPPGVEQHRIADLRSERGSLEMFTPPHVLVTRAIGHMDAGMADEWIRRTDRIFSTPGTIAVFNEWSEMQSYDSQARSKLTSWVLDHRSRIEGAWFLTGSRLVAMGVAVAGSATALAGVTMHASLDRPKWERVLRSKLGR